MKVTVQSEPTYLIELTLKEAQLLKSYFGMKTPMTVPMQIFILNLHDTLDAKGVPSL